MSDVFMDILRHTNIYPVINRIETVYVLLKDYSEFNRTDFISCVNEYIDNLKEEQFDDSSRFKKTWDYYFSTDELLRDMLVFYLHLEPTQWTGIFDKYTSYSTSEINEFIISHAETFELDINDYGFYSSALVG